MTRKASAGRFVGGLGVALAMLVHAPRAQAQLEVRLDALEAALASIYDGHPVTLEECIQAALVGSANLGRLDEDVQNANVDVMAAYGEWLPSLSASGSWSKSQRTDFDSEVLATQYAPVFFLDEDGNVIPQPLEVGGEIAYQAFAAPTGELVDTTIDTKFASASLTASWEIFNGTGRFHTVGRAKADRAAAEATLAYQESVLIQNVRKAYYDHIRAQLRVEVAEEAEALALQELERSETYFELGISTRSDVLQAKVRHSQTKLDTVRERNGQRNTFAALAHVMNIPSGSTFEVDQTSVEVSTMEVAPLESLLGTGRTQRDDLAAAEFNLVAREKAVSEARSGFWPSISIFGQWNRSRSETPFRFGATENQTYSWGFQGSWNIFDRFQTKANTRRSMAQRRRAEYDLRQAQLDFELEVVQIRNNLIEVRERHALASDTIEQAQEDLRLAEERFRVGAGTSLDVINAQVNLARARRDEVDARVDYARYQADLDRATGAR